MPSPSPSGGQLPYTGTDLPVGPLGAVALGALTVGLWLTTRRRRRRS